MSLEVAYVGSKGTHGFVADESELRHQPGAGGRRQRCHSSLPGFEHPTTAVSCGRYTKPAGNCGPATYKGFSAFTSQNSRRPLFPTIPFDLGNYYGNDAASTYNAFEVKIDKRFSNGLQFLSHYTFSHANGYARTTTTPSAMPLSWGPVDFNRDQVFVFSPIYELPFGGARSTKAMPAERWITSSVDGRSAIPPTGAAVCRGRRASASAAPSSTPVRAVRMWAGENSHLSVGPLDPVNHTRTFFTPVAPLAYPDPNTLPVGTDACSLSASGFWPVRLPNCGQIGNGKAQYLPRSKRLLFRPVGLEGFRNHGTGEGEVPHERLQHLQSPGVCLQPEQRGERLRRLSGLATTGRSPGWRVARHMRQLEFAVRFEF